jgi:hypothetical protein
MTLLVVHEAKLLGKLKVVSCCEKKLPAEISEGSAPLGAKVVGYQHLNELQKAY